MNKDDRQENHCGFSRDILIEHYNHYPAVQQNKIKEIEARLIKADVAMANSNYCPLRSLKKEHTYALNSVKLHKNFLKIYRRNSIHNLHWKCCTCLNEILVRHRSGKNNFSRWHCAPGGGLF